MATSCIFIAVGYRRDVAKHSPVFILLLVLLIGCGSAQPTGALAECLGTRSFQERSGDGYVLNFPAGYRVGQYVDVAVGTVIKSVMLRASSSGITRLKVGIYYGMPWDLSGSSEQLLTEMTISQTQSSGGVQDLWLDLPQPFVFPEVPSLDSGFHYSYFFVFSPLDGTLGVPTNNVGKTSNFRKGFRYGGSNQWFNSYTDQGVGIGFRTNSDCISR